MVRKKNNPVLVSFALRNCERLIARAYVQNPACPTVRFFVRLYNDDAVILCVLQGGIVQDGGKYASSKTFGRFKYLFAKLP